MIILSYDFLWIYKLDGTLIFPLPTEKNYRNIFTGHSDVGQITSFYSYALHPEDSSNQLISGGERTLITVVDISKLSETTPSLDQSSLLYIKQISGFPQHQNTLKKMVENS